MDVDVLLPPGKTGEDSDSRGEVSTIGVSIGGRYDVEAIISLLGATFMLRFDFKDGGITVEDDDDEVDDGLKDGIFRITFDTDDSSSLSAQSCVFGTACSFFTITDCGVGLEGVLDCCSSLD